MIQLETSLVVIIFHTLTSLKCSPKSWKSFLKVATGTGIFVGEVVVRVHVWSIKELPVDVWAPRVCASRQGGFSGQEARDSGGNACTGNCGSRTRAARVRVTQHKFGPVSGRRQRRWVSGQEVVQAQDRGSNGSRQAKGCRATAAASRARATEHIRG